MEFSKQLIIKYITKKSCTKLFKILLNKIKRRTNKRCGIEICQTQSYAEIVQSISKLMNLKRSPILIKLGGCLVYMKGIIKNLF